MTLADKIKRLFSKKTIDDEMFDELEEMLIEADIHAVTAIELVDEIRSLGKIKNQEDIRGFLKERISSYLQSISLEPNPDVMQLYLVLGVNGVGKTTTIAKLANYYMNVYGINEPVLSAGDTFRAAAIDQLKIHGERLGLRVVHQEPGSDPGAVIFDTIESCQSKGNNLIIADTAGRMHNKENLIRELQKIDKIVAKKGLAGGYKKILVIDANTGQNGFRQAETFNEAVGIDAIVLTKMDSTAKGGVAVNICKELGIPISFVGFGEKYEHISPFDKNAFIESMIGK